MTLSDVAVTDVSRLVNHYEMVDSSGKSVQTDIEFETIKMAQTGTNHYQTKPTPTQVTLSATKQLVGGDIHDYMNQFVFQIVEKKADGSEKIIESIKNNDTSGQNIIFSPIIYKEAGVHHYIIREVAGNNEDIQYDTNEKNITVTVTQNGDELVTDIPDNQKNLGEFINILKTSQLKKGTIAFKKVTKFILPGQEGLSFEFSKPLKGVEFALQQDGVNKYFATSDGEGMVVFRDIPYGEYQLVETKPLEGYLPLEEPKTVTINQNNQVIDLGEIVNIMKKGKLIIHKVDADDHNTTIKGVVFELSSTKEGSSYAKTAVTYENGEAVFENIPFGEYQVKELLAAQSYQQLAEPFIINITEDGQVLEKIITNEKIKGSVIFTKVDADNPEQPLKGVEFALQQDGENKYTATSNDEGQVIFTDVIYGVYDLVETQPQEGYLPLEKQVAAVNIDQQQKQIDLGTITNQIKKGSIKVTKVDAEDTTKTLAGVTFGLYQGDTKVAEAVTNEDGVALFTGVNYGEYTLRESKSLENYVLSNEIKEVTISENGKQIDLGQITNKKIKGSLEVTKVDAENKATKLQDAVFTLVSKTDETMRFEATTNEEGIAIFNDLPYGEYTLTETTAPTGYLVSTIPIDVTITTDGQKVQQEVSNEKIKRTIKFTKEWQGAKQDSVVINLLADGKKVAELTLSEQTNWIGTFVDIPQFDLTDGHEINYTVTENTIDDYKTDITGSMADGFVVTNTEQPIIPETPTTPEQPTKPNKPEKPEKPEKPVTPIKPNKPEIPNGKPSVPNVDIPQTPGNPQQPTKPHLPTTGATSSLTSIIAAVVLMGIGTIILKKRNE
ncbi:LPXTG-motif cell wall anchor domain-containing protein/pilin isopeptide linkage domain-containing protein [Granulicatella balaenopterae]|uniref:LPXTG-motif cell wall anchor domain-containing protein/pilin isopeptide linkage domain-containing protein n=1 Tax=Granulicatella balaenopterae TaxID=137733 RepID=A0A1H9KYN0_9LACT|nr:SpaA isopeptide-forming pilin-related protein [Granulicatella balaenopterae]SER04351.1 LPXTG-motif cell wall anchor domain-containing protein/pilin isopeptide linkage domain-containing protein [Granulicatella balaenopterae]